MAISNQLLDYFLEIKSFVSAGEEAAIKFCQPGMARVLGAPGTSLALLLNSVTLARAVTSVPPLVPHFCKYYNNILSYLHIVGIVGRVKDKSLL
jgi:hypothetical protein